MSLLFNPRKKSQILSNFQCYQWQPVMRLTRSRHYWSRSCVALDLSWQTITLHSVLGSDCPGSGQYGGLVQLYAGQLKSTGPRLKTSLVRVRTILCSLQCNGGVEGSLPPLVSIHKYIFCPRTDSPVRGVGLRVAWSASVTWPELGWEKSAEC